MTLAVGIFVVAMGLLNGLILEWLYPGVKHFQCQQTVTVPVTMYCTPAPSYANS
jgi:hypothetical protein